jgi:hypothetical protein
MEPLIQSEAHTNIERIQTILSTDIFEICNREHPLKRSAFIELMICLRDILYKVEKFAGHRVSFNDHIYPSRDIHDITDLIKFARDSVCHIDSVNHIYNGNGARISFNILYGKGELCGSRSDFDDEVSFIFGEHRIYLKRHIIKAFTEAKSAIKPKLTIFELS